MIAREREEQIVLKMMEAVTLEERESMRDEAPQVAREAMEDAAEKSNVGMGSGGMGLGVLISPKHIHDHGKLSWALGPGELPELLMSQKYPHYDNLLNEYFKLLGSKESPFSFVSTYPHTTTLKSNLRFTVGQEIISFSCNHMLDERLFFSTKIYQYLTTMVGMIDSFTDIFVQPRSEMKTCLILSIGRNVKRAMELASVLYLFETYFVREICRQIPAYSVSGEWLYFQLLPTDFSYLPIRYHKEVRQYHPIIADFLQDKEQNIIQCFTNLRNLVEGKQFRTQYNFLAFLNSQNGMEAGNLIYNKYIEQLNAKNFLWAYQCQSTRIYNSVKMQKRQKLRQRDQEGEGESKVKRQRQDSSKPFAFIPILDLLHHSYKKNNVSWSLNERSGTLVLRACKQIQCGDLLYCSYNGMAIQNQMVEYGFVDVDSECYIGIPLTVQGHLIVTFIEKLTGHVLSDNIRNWVHSTLLINYHQLQLGFTTKFIKSATSAVHLLQQLTRIAFTELSKYAIHLTSFFKSETFPLIQANQPEYKSSNIRKMIQKAIITSLMELQSSKRAQTQFLKTALAASHNYQSNFNLHYAMRCLYSILVIESNWLDKIKSELQGRK